MEPAAAVRAAPRARSSWATVLETLARSAGKARNGAARGGGAGGVPRFRGTAPPARHESLSLASALDPLLVLVPVPGGLAGTAPPARHESLSLASALDPLLVLVPVPGGLAAARPPPQDMRHSPWQVPWTLSWSWFRFLGLGRGTAPPARHESLSLASALDPLLVLVPAWGLGRGTAPPARHETLSLASALDPLLVLVPVPGGLAGHGPPRRHEALSLASALDPFLVLAPVLGARRGTAPPRGHETLSLASASGPILVPVLAAPGRQSAAGFRRTVRVSTAAARSRIPAIANEFVYFPGTSPADLTRVWLRRGRTSPPTPQALNRTP